MTLPEPLTQPNISSSPSHTPTHETITPKQPANASTQPAPPQEQNHEPGGAQQLHHYMGIVPRVPRVCPVAHYTSSVLPRVVLRLLSLVPVIVLLTLLPLRLHTIHLGGPTAFFLVWLANSKLLLFAFHLGPLADSPSLLHFLLVSTLPVKVSESAPQPLDSGNGQGRRLFLLLLKALLLASIVRSYRYRSTDHAPLIYALYCVHLYLELEIVLKLCALPAMVLLGYELEPQFDEPYLATSLQDFWGRRWNLMVSKILRSTVYDPVRAALAHSTGKESSTAVATIASFTVSGLMHEVLYFYMSRARPTWEVTLFFVLHGVCVAVEVAVKRKVGNSWWLNRAVSGALTLGFVGVTGVWLFFPQLVRSGVVEKALMELQVRA